MWFRPSSVFLRFSNFPWMYFPAFLRKLFFLNNSAQVTWNLNILWISVFASFHTCLTNQLVQEGRSNTWTYQLQNALFLDFYKASIEPKVELGIVFKEGNYFFPFKIRMIQIAFELYTFRLYFQIFRFIFSYFLDGFISQNANVKHLDI